MSKLSPSPGMLSAPIAASVMSKVTETTNSSPSRTTLMDSSWPAPNVSSGSPSKVVVVPMYSPSSYGSDWTFVPSLKSKVSPDSCSARAAGSWPAICATSEEMAKIMVPSTVSSDCRSSCMSILTQPVSCLLYTSDAADDLLCVDLGGRRIIKKKKKKQKIYKQ